MYTLTPVLIVLVFSSVLLWYIGVERYDSSKAICLVVSNILISLTAYALMGCTTLLEVTLTVSAFLVIVSTIGWEKTSEHKLDVKMVGTIYPLIVLPVTFLLIK